MFGTSRQHVPAALTERQLSRPLLREEESEPGAALGERPANAPHRLRPSPTSATCQTFPPGGFKYMPL